MGEISDIDPIEIKRITAAADAAELILAKREAQRGNILPYLRFQWPFLELDGFQDDAMVNLFRHEIRQVWVKGNTGCGKNLIIALAAIAYYDIWDDAKVVLTRDSFERAVSIVYSEVCRWLRSMRVPPVGILKNAKFQHPINENHLIEVVNPGSEEGFSGVHSPHVFFIFDEATAEVFDTAQPGKTTRFALAGTQATKFLACANPRTTTGTFRNAFPRANPNENCTIPGPYGLKRCITVSGMDCRNIREKRLSTPISPDGGIEIEGRFYPAGEAITPEHYELVKPIIPGQTTYDTYRGHLLNPDPNFVAIFAHGRFPDEDPDKQLIPGSWLEVPRKRWRAFQKAKRYFRGRKYFEALLPKLCPITAAGLDVAASLAGDESILTVGGRYGVAAQFAKQTPRTTDLCTWVVSTMRTFYGVNLAGGGFPIGVDVDGIGRGVADMLIQMGVTVIECKGNETPSIDPKTYFNARAENYGEVARRLDPQGNFQRSRFLLPDDQRLIEELVAHEKIFKDRDAIRFRVTPKDNIGDLKDVATIKQKIGRSPDRSDSLVYFFRALNSPGGYDMSEAIRRAF